MKSKMKKLSLIISSLVIATFCFGQFAINNTGIGPHEYAVLDLQSADKGFLPPRVTESTLPASPVEGLIVYITDGNFPGLYQYQGTTWCPLRSNTLKGRLKLPFTTGPVTGNVPNVFETDGSLITATSLGNGSVEFDISAYGFTAAPVVLATSEYVDISEPTFCNGEWGDGTCPNNHLHFLYLRNLPGPYDIIKYETYAPDLGGGFIDNTHGEDRCQSFDSTTGDDAPPGRYTYYDQDNDDPSLWDDLWPVAGNGDEFPNTDATLATGEVYNGSGFPLVANEFHNLQVRAAYNTLVELGGSFDSRIDVYIDYNKDGDYLDTGEDIYSSGTTINTWAAIEQINFLVPATALNGKARLRVVVTKHTTETNPDEGEACLANFSGVYTGHTYEFDVWISGGESPFIFEGSFCNVAEVTPTAFRINCYDLDGVPADDRTFHFTMYDKF